jgi:hypothetical protein
VPAPFKRPCPDDFDVILVEQGRLECERWYRARRTTVSWWLEQRGKDRLLAARAAFVKHVRALAKQPRRRKSREQGEYYELRT